MSSYIITRYYYADTYAYTQRVPIPKINFEKYFSSLSFILFNVFLLSFLFLLFWLPSLRQKEKMCVPFTVYSFVMWKEFFCNIFLSLLSWCIPLLLYHLPVLPSSIISKREIRYVTYIFHTWTNFQGLFDYVNYSKIFVLSVAVRNE